jgi:hypothetical protein
MRVFGHVTSTFEILPDKKMRGTITIPSGHTNCIPFFVICGGVMQRLPGVFGLPDSKVSLTIEGQTGIYLIEAPPHLTLMDRAIHLWRTIFSSGEALKVLTDQNRNSMKRSFRKRKPEAVLRLPG